MTNTQAITEISTRYRVRQMTSGYNGVTKFNVYDLVGKGRVNVHAHVTRESAQAHADDLNIGDMVKPHAEDPRPYAERLAEARAAYDAARQA